VFDYDREEYHRVVSLRSTAKKQREQQARKKARRVGKPSERSGLVRGGFDYAKASVGDVAKQLDEDKVELFTED